MARRSGRRGSYLNILYDHFERDQTLTIVATVYFTIIAIMMLLAGLAIWPAVIYGATAQTAFHALCRNVLLCNVFLLVFHVALAAVLLWFDKHFSFVKTVLITLSAGGVFNLIVLLSQSGAFLSNTGVDFTLTLLWFILSFFLSWVLALLPAVLVAGIAKAIHSTFFLLNR